ncbi:MAG: co-chaperone GroES [Parcubacteria group bacterium]|nr:co-chaperone GroES [Parcubacteria group bacterium]
MSTKKQKEIIPLGDKVLIKAVVDEKQTDSGIIIPDTAKEERPQIGRVVAVGEGKRSDTGELMPMTVKKGNTVLFSKYGPDEITVDGEEFLITSESNILAIIK